MLYIFSMALAMYSVRVSSVYPHFAYRDCSKIFQMLSSLFIATRYDVGKHLNLGLSEVITTNI